MASVLFAPFAAMLSTGHGAVLAWVALILGVALGNTARRRARRQGVKAIRFIASCGYALCGFPVAFGIAALLVWVTSALVGLVSVAVTSMA